MFLFVFFPFCSFAAVPFPASPPPPPAIAPLSATATVVSSSSLAPLWEGPDPSPALLRSLLEGVTAELNGLPKESKEEGVEQQRGLLQKRLLLLQEYGEVVERLRVLKSGSGERRLQEEALKKSLEQMALQAPPKAPERPTPEAFKQVQEALEKANQGVELLTAQAKERQLLLGQIPEKSVAAKERWQQAELVLQQSRELVAKAEGSKKRLLTLQAENARLDGLIAQALGLRWEAEQAAAMEGVTLHDRQLEIAQANRQYQQKKFALYQEALNSRQAADLTVRQEELQKKEQAARQASSPEQIFLTRWELEIARLQKESADLSKWQTDLVAAVSEQEHLLQNEKDELKNLETLTRQFGAQGLAADILKDNFTRLTRRRWELREPLHPELLERIADLQPRLFLMDSALVELNSSWTATMAEIQARLPTAGEKEYFAQLANGLRNNYRQLLSTGKRQIFDLQASGQRLQLLTLERTSTLNATETFLVSRIFWIQDAPPLGMAVLQQLVDELFSSVRPTALPNVWRHGWTAGWIESAWETLRKPTTLLAGLFLLGLLPPFLWWASRRLRSVVVAASPPAGGQAAPVRAEAVVAQLLQPALGPLYLLTLYLASHLFTAPIPMVAAAQPLLFHVLQQGGLSLALFWFLWESNRQLLTVHGPAERLLRLHPDVRGSLARTLESALLASLLFLPAWYIFRAAPFHYEALPRLSYTLFECSIAFLLYRLMRADAPLPRHAFAAPAAHHPPVAAAKRVSPLLFSRHWTGISRLLSLAMGVVVGLDVAGYRFGAAWLAANGMRTILTFFLLIGLYRALASAVEALIRRRRRMPTVLAPGARGTLTRSQIARQINDSLRLLFILGGLVLMSSYWGVHEHLFQLFKGVTLYNTTSNDGQLVLVTLLDFVHFLLTLLVVGWVVKHLPRIYELLLFSWLSLDAGSRYAVLTISRYLIFIIGLLTALNNLHLDIAKIGWLVAAISVGIGFGLQEIVANFVSGIILLLERPVRVGDMITIGNTITGRITRINIRATTVLNTDYQEQLIPNRDLITKEVTNWTLANNTLRIVVPIGVAYGSDIGQVKQLLLDLARAQPEVLAEPPPEALFTHHGASSLDFELRVFLPDPGLRWVIRDRLNTEINRAFIQHGIEIPFPQQEVRIRASELTGAG
ncbi:MAG: mechanosensitive ion channel [Magnetococcus sp. YQC-3]